jgi:hypothetical protein
MIKIIWVLIALNTLGLLIFIAAYFVLNNGKNVDSMEKGWTFILAGMGLLLILLAALPLRFSQSTFSMIFSGFFAALPLAVGLCIVISNQLSSLKKKPTLASTYYKSKPQLAIANAIEQNDTLLLTELIKGQDLNIEGNRVNDFDGLNYLQFAIRVRSNPISFPYNETANTAAIRLLIQHGSATTPALAEATQYLPLKTLSLLLEAGADPNCRGFVSPDPLLFELIRNEKKQIDKAILLLQKGADVNAKNEDYLTPVMYAAHNARLGWKNTWRLVIYMLDKANADYTHTTKDGNNLANIIRQTRMDAEAKKVTMPGDFYKVVEWLKQHQVDTEPLESKIL